MKQNKSGFIFGVIGVIGIAVTAYFAAKATPSAIERCVDSCGLHPADFKESPPEDKWKIVKSMAPSYVPAIAFGVATSSCIIGSQILSRKHQASLIGAYTMLDRSYKEYTKKVQDIFGDSAPSKVRAKVIQDDPPVGFAPAPGELLFYDDISNSYFENSMLGVIDAEYQLNKLLAINGEVTYRQYCDLMGIDCDRSGDAIGWSFESFDEFDNAAWIDFEHELVILPDGMECYNVHIATRPVLL